MTKITTDQIRVDVSASVLIDANKLRMQHLQTAEIKNYSEIEASDIENWIVEDCIEVMKIGDEIEFEMIDLNEG